MSYKSVTMLAALALLMLAAAHAQTGQQGQKDEQKDEEIIDGFVTSRGFGIVDVPKTGAKPKPTPRTRRRPNSGSVAKNKSATPNGVKPSGGTTAGSAETAQQNGVPSGQGADGGATPDGAKIVNASDTLLQVGYTIYLKDSRGLLPVPASKSFRASDGIVLTVETNADGYLYVFNAPNGKDPVLVYPDADFGDATNEVRAHVPETYPTGRATFAFDDTPATEHLFIIVSRKPLENVPTGAALKKFCAKSTGENPCEWRPTAGQWSRIAAAALDSNAREVRSGLLAQANVEPVMPEMVSRGIRLKKQEPPPAVVRVADTPGATMLVTKIELLHQ
ncbi:MAG TPA: DUF4384 domain-containing protein [Pyrinomonadaceae bacterium]|jgi:hypothetical protein|nr:DUF4384 domain-containing protein [Pyrinomonadaceae bacterium]